MAFSLNDFRANLTFGGARPNLFMVEINNPIDGSADLKTPWMIKTASLPASVNGKIPVPFMGRFVNFGGEAEFEDWTVTVIADEDFLIRNALEAWHDRINTHLTNRRAYPAEYKSQGQITQMAKDGTALRVYKFTGLFPINISAIETSWETQNTVEEFTVTFSLDEFYVDGGTTGRPFT